jgi:futalosine hydrolase
VTRLLIVTAVPAESAALAAGLGAAAQVLDVRTGTGAAGPHEVGRNETGPNKAGSAEAGSVEAGPVGVAAVGVGPAASAAGTARLLALAEGAGRPYRWVLSIGIGGGFTSGPGPQRPPEIGGIVLATRCVGADLGADSPAGFLPLDQLGFGTAEQPVDADLLARLRVLLPDAVTGTVLTVSTVTGTAEGAAELTARYPDRVAEAMEGFGVATAAAQVGAGFAEIRTISNPVGPRDRAGWRIPAALAALEVVGAAVGKLVG